MEIFELTRELMLNMLGLYMEYQISNCSIKTFNAAKTYAIPYVFASRFTAREIGVTLIVRTLKARLIMKSTDVSKTLIS